MMERGCVMVETRRERSLSVRVGRGAQIIETVVVLEKEKFVKKATLNKRFSSHLLLLLWRTLMCRRMMERRWEVRRLKVSRLMHARPMTCINKKLTNETNFHLSLQPTVLTRWQSTGPPATAGWVPGVRWTSTRQPDAAAVTRQTLLWKRKLFENFLMNPRQKFFQVFKLNVMSLPEPQSLTPCQRMLKPFHGLFNQKFTLEQLLDFRN